MVLASAVWARSHLKQPALPVSLIQLQKTDMEQNAGFPKESRIGGFTIKDLSRPVIPWTGCDSTTKGQAIGQATSWGHAEPPALLPISGGTLRAERPQPEGAAAAEGWEGHLGICSQILFWWGGVGKNGINPKEVLPFSFLPPGHLEGRVCVCVCCRKDGISCWLRGFSIYASQQTQPMYIAGVPWFPTCSGGRQVRCRLACGLNLAQDAQASARVIILTVSRGYQSQKMGLFPFT